MGGKRKNRNSTDGGGNAKRQKLNKRPSAVNDEANGKRKRRRTKQLREDLRTEIERALKMQHSPVAHLFKEVDEEGTPYAPFWDVIQRLKVDESAIRAVSEVALVKMSNLTSMFTVYLDPNDRQLKISYRPVGASIEDCTVYIDNLPIGCNEDKLNKLLVRYGTVVELKIPRAKSRKVALPSGDAEVGRGRMSFAFVQFTEAEAAQRMAQAYEQNAPRIGRPRPKRLAMVDLWRHIKKYQLRGDRMSWMEIIALRRLRRRMRILHRKEYLARRKLRKQRYLDLVAAGLIEPRPPRKRRFCRRRGKGKKKAVAVKKTKETPKKPLRNTPKKAAPPKVENDVPEVQMKKKRHRKRWKRRLKPGYIKGSVANHFELIQVLPFKKYRELRDEYTALRDAARKEQRMAFRRCQQMDDVCQDSKTAEEFHDRAWRSNDCNDHSDDSFM